MYTRFFFIALFVALFVTLLCYTQIYYICVVHKYNTIVSSPWEYPGIICFMYIVWPIFFSPSHVTTMRTFALYYAVKA